MEVVIITGMSGAGKTKAADWFEDKGYYCIDNMPPALIKNFIELAMVGDRKVDKAALVVDIRGGQFFSELKATLLELEKDANVDLKILFIDASDETVIKRFNETRRNHPLSAASITRETIADERRILEELKSRANFVIDTSHLKVAELNSELEKLFMLKTKKEAFVLNFMSFGYKHGAPTEADWVIDVRFIPNPYYVASLRKLTGKNKKVSQYVLKHDITKEFVNRLYEMIIRTVPFYAKEGKYSLTIAFGCTGGQHRSVAIAGEFWRLFTVEGWRATLEHREL